VWPFWLTTKTMHRSAPRTVYVDHPFALGTAVLMHIQGVHEVATLHVKLSDVPQHLFIRHIDSFGLVYHSLSFEVEISVQSSLEFSVSVKGKKYGSVTAKYA
jgi:hypothetical protein